MKSNGRPVGVNVFPVVLIYVVAIEYFIPAHGRGFKRFFVKKMCDTLAYMIVFLLWRKVLDITQQFIRCKAFMINITAICSNDINRYLSPPNRKPRELHAKTVGRARIGKRMQAGVGKDDAMCRHLPDRSLFLRRLGGSSRWRWLATGAAAGGNAYEDAPGKPVSSSQSIFASVVEQQCLYIYRGE